MEEKSQIADLIRFGYQGQFAEKDQETGYTQFEARLYDARIGRWLSTDPAGQYWSPYMAMGNNPAMMIDPDGQFAGPVVQILYNIANALGLGAVWNVPGVSFGIAEGSLRGLAMGSALGSSSMFSTILTSGNIVYANHYVFEDLTPYIYQNTKSYLRQYPEKSLLTYNGGGISTIKNRYNACKGYSLCSPGASRDEFPYASTEEGGYGASVHCVPINEQKIQALQLRHAYKGLKKGDKIRVILVPKGNPNRVPLPDYIPLPRAVPKPYFFPIPVPIFQLLPALI